MPDLSDPAPALGPDPVARPSVARRPGRDRGRWGYGVAVLAGGAVLVSMTMGRHARDGGLIPPAAAATVRFTDPQPLPTSAAAGTSALAGTTSAILAPQFSTDNHLAEVSGAGTPMPPPVLMAAATTSSPGAATAGVARGGPAMVVDLSDPSAAGLKADGAPANPALASGPKAGASTGDAGEAQFLQRVSGAAEGAQATRIGKRDAIVAEGTTVSATLETGIDSDVAGYARAVIARDVMSFDGTRMLIPRGSRVVGQYKANVAAGTSRVFVVWTRLIRPDGVTIQLGSPSTDDLGRGGLTGKVQRHFLERYGGALLTSVLNSVAESGGAAVALRNGAIAPTVRTPPGAAIKIFVARDLDFSDVDGTS